AYITNTAGCAIVTPFILEVSNIAGRNAILHACDTNLNGLQVFDLNDAAGQLLNNQAGSPNIAFYATENGALLEDNADLIPQNYTNIIPYNQLVFARIENNNACYAISEINLTIDRLPDFELIAEIEYCNNFFPETILVEPDYNLESDQAYSYRWMPEGQETPQLKTNLVGTHTLTVTNTTTGCSSSRSIEIIGKDIPTITNIEVTDVSENNTATILASGNDIYSYSLDFLGPWQDSNIFTHLSPGFYTAYVKSNSGCGLSSKEFSVIGHMKFFTPNGDGYNDYWQVQGINDQIQPKTLIFIFNRFGKLVKQLDPKSQGWDGKYNGRLLPSDDYWFRITLEDGREIKSHFTLKR
ncbi:MAG: T9SS type B sorting domain-containing protein, partial [Leeuwenhoekiella sp.]